MIRRSLRIGIKCDARLLNFDCTGLPHRRIVRKRVVEIRAPKLAHQLLVILPLRWGEHVRLLLGQVALRQRQTLRERNLAIIRLIHIFNRAQDACIRQDIAQPDMHGFEPVQRFFPIPGLLQIENTFLGDGAQVLRQPLPFERSISGPLAHAGGYCLGFDSSALQRFGELRLHLALPETCQLIFAHVGTRIDAIAGRCIEQGCGPVPKRIQMRDRSQDIGELALDLRPLRCRRLVNRRLDLPDVLRKLGDQRVERCVVAGHIEDSVRLNVAAAGKDGAGPLKCLGHVGEVRP